VSPWNFATMSTLTTIISVLQVARPPDRPCGSRSAPMRIGCAAAPPSVTAPPPPVKRNRTSQLSADERWDQHRVCAAHRSADEQYPFVFAICRAGHRTQRSAICPFCQCLTLPEWVRPREITDSMLLIASMNCRGAAWPGGLRGRAYGATARLARYLLAPYEADRSSVDCRPRGYDRARAARSLQLLRVHDTALADLLTRQRFARYVGQPNGPTLPAQHRHVRRRPPPAKTPPWKGFPDLTDDHGRVRTPLTAP
jgi:hypothetical protein